MRSKAFWGYSEEQMTAFQEELTVTAEQVADPLRQYIVAERKGSILGYYALVRLTETRCELDSLFVDPAHIGHGVGRALMEHAVEAARSRGVTSVIIQGDPNAAPFYRAAGAVQTGERESGSIPGRFLPEFEITLRPDHVCRPYRPNHLEACLAMLRANTPESFAPNEEEDYRRFLDAAPDDYHVWQKGDAVEGAHGLSTGDGQARIRWIMTRPGSRGSGLGRAMMEYALITARRAGIRRIHIAASQKSAAFFGRFGARPVQTRAGGWGPGLDRVDMVLDLPG